MMLVSSTIARPPRTPTFHPKLRSPSAFTVAITASGFSSMHKAKSHRQYGAALIIVLAFVVLLTAVTIVYFSQTTADRQTAQTSFSESNADQIASSGVGVILGDLRQEIINGSVSPAPSFAPSPAGTPYYAYLPTSTLNMVPKRSGTPSAAPAIPNLVRRSVRNDPIVVPGFPSRASAVNSVTDASANGRSITLPRWNSHYLIPKLNTCDDKPD